VVLRRGSGPTVLEGHTGDRLKEQVLVSWIQPLGIYQDSLGDVRTIVQSLESPIPAGDRRPGGFVGGEAVKEPAPAMGVLQGIY